MTPHATLRAGIWTALESSETRTLVYAGRYKSRRGWFRLSRYLRKRMARARLSRIRGVR